MRTFPVLAQEEIDACHNACRRLRDELGARNLKYYVESYGCQMNDRDSETICGILESAGYLPAVDKRNADLILFNTCCIREHAELRVCGNLGAVKELKESRPGLLVAVCGCMMQQKAVSTRIYRRFPFVDIIFGTNEMHLFPQFLLQALEGERVYAVQDSGNLFLGHQT